MMLKLKRICCSVGGQISVTLRWIMRFIHAVLYFSSNFDATNNTCLACAVWFENLYHYTIWKCYNSVPVRTLNYYFVAVQTSMLMNSDIHNRPTPIDMQIPAGPFPQRTLLLFIENVSVYLVIITAENETRLHTVTGGERDSGPVNVIIGTIPKFCVYILHTSANCITGIQLMCCVCVRETVRKMCVCRIFDGTWAEWRATRKVL